MITMISAFMVKTTPDRGIEGQKHADEHAAGRDQRAAERKGQRRDVRHVDADQARRVGSTAIARIAVPTRVRVSAR